MYSPHSSLDISLTLITMVVPAKEAVRRTPSQSLFPVRTALHTISSTQLLVHNINLSSSFLNLEIAAARDSKLAGSSKIERVLGVLHHTLEIISTSAICTPQTTALLTLTLGTHLAAATLILDSLTSAAVLGGWGAPVTVIIIWLFTT